MCVCVCVKGIVEFIPGRGTVNGAAESDLEADTYALLLSSVRYQLDLLSYLLGG